MSFKICSKRLRSCVTAIVVLTALLLTAPHNADAASLVRKDAFLSMLLRARGFEPHGDAQDTAVYVLKTGIVQDRPDSIASPVTRMEAVRWIVQSLGLSIEAEILTDVKLPFEDIGELSPFDRGCLVIGMHMRPALLKTTSKTFAPSNNVSEAEVKAMLSVVRQAGLKMKLNFKFSPAPGMELEVYREGVFSGIPKWRAYVDGFDDRASLDTMQSFLSSQGFKMEAKSASYEWSLRSDLFEDYAQIRRLTSLAQSQHKTVRAFPIVTNTKADNKPLYWVLLTINPAAYRMTPVVSPNGITTLAPLSSMLESSGATAAINAGFFGNFGHWIGAPIGALRIEKALVSAPYKGRTCLGWNDFNSAAFGAVEWDGRVQLDQGWMPINLLNSSSKGNAISIYRHQYGKPTPVQDNVVEAIVRDNKCLALKSGGGSTIEEGSFILAGYGSNAKVLSKYVTPGNRIEIIDTIVNGDQKWNSMSNIIQAGPFLIRNGKIGIEAEGFNKSFINLRHPRSVVGFTGGGKWFMFVGDGRSSVHSGGFTLPEVATLLKSKGAAYALNLDGGGSSQIMINNKTYNHPSEGKERAISYAVGCFSRK